MKALVLFKRLMLRFRYPLSLPEEVANALGVDIPHHLSFEEFVYRLTCLQHKPTRLERFMPREQAEEAFAGALRKERYRHNTLFFYHFNQGWLEFTLHFDDESRLRRIYIRHKNIKHDHGIEIPLRSLHTHHQKALV